MGRQEVDLPGSLDFWRGDNQPAPAEAELRGAPVKALVSSVCSISLGDLVGRLGFRVQRLECRVRDLQDTWGVVVATRGVAATTRPRGVCATVHVLNRQSRYGTPHGV